MPKTPDLTPEERAGLGERIRVLVEAAGTHVTAAEIAHVTPRQLARFISGENAPSAVPLARLAEATGISLDWVMLGHGPVQRLSRAVASTDHELLGQLTHAIASACRDVGAQLPDVDLGRLVGEEHDLIVAATSNPRERAMAIRIATDRVRRSLQSDPGMDQDRYAHARPSKRS